MTFDLSPTHLTLSASPQIQDAIAVNAAVALAVDNAKLAQDDFRTKSEAPPTSPHDTPHILEKKQT